VKIQVNNIPDEGLTLRISKTGDWVRTMLEGSEDISFSLDEVRVEMSISKIESTVSLSGVMETAFEFECCRCLNNFTLPAKSRFSYTFVPEEIMPDEEDLELTGDDLGFGYYKDDTIDIAPLILEQIMIQIPIKPLCKESCKGLCPQCGTDLNEAECGHESTTPETSPFAALKDFKVNKANK
jgi:uncharacterized protein